MCNKQNYKLNSLLYFLITQVFFFILHEDLYLHGLFFILHGDVCMNVVDLLFTCFKYIEILKVI